MIIAFLVILIIFIAGTITFSGSFFNFSSPASSGRMVKKKKVFLSDRTINLICGLNIASHTIKLVSILLFPKPSLLITAGKFFWYYPYILFYNAGMIIASLLIWKRKKVGLYLYLAIIVVTFPLNNIADEYANLNPYFLTFFYFCSIAINVWFGKKIWLRFS